MSQLLKKSKRRVSKVFDVKFELKKARAGKRQTPAEGLFEFFIKHFGEIGVATQYKVTVEVVK